MPKQGKLEGFTEPEAEELIEAIEKYDDAKNARMKKSVTEVEAKNKLLDIMAKHKKKTFSTDEWDVEIKTDKIKLKVTRKNRESDDGKDKEAAE